MNAPEQTSAIWNARRAILCVLTLLVSFLTVLGTILFLTLQLHRSPPRSTLVVSMAVVLMAGFALAITVQRSGVRDAAEFRSRFGLLPYPGREVVVSFVAGVVIQFVCLAIQLGGLATIHPRRSPGIGALAMIVVSVVDEIIVRGFLYPAFRGSYSRTISTLIIVGGSVLMSVSVVRHAPITIVPLAAMSWIACELRERFGTTWLPIGFHLGGAAVLILTTAGYFPLLGLGE